MRQGTTPVEQAICADRDLKALDDRLGTVYAEARALTAKTRRPGLAAAQKLWIADRETCAGVLPGPCIRARTARRIGLLSGSPASGPGTAGRLLPEFILQPGSDSTYAIDVTLLRFVNPATPGQQRLNRHADDLARGIPFGPHGDAPNPYYSYGLSTYLDYASPRLISVSVLMQTYSGGAHPNHAISHLNIDMTTGRDLSMDQIFTAGALSSLAADCKAQIIAEKTIREQANGFDYDPAGDPALHNGTIEDHVTAQDRWGFTDTGAQVDFDPYSIGAYAEGAFQCLFPLATLQALALPGAPLP